VKRLFFLPILLIAISESCQHKAVPDITTRAVPKPAMHQALYAISGTVKPDLVFGMQLFVNRCRQCHSAPDFSNYTVKRAETVLQWMIPRARIDTI